MPQLFTRSTNTLARLSIVVVILLLGLGGWLVLELNRSPFVTKAFVAREQPVQFSHKHHAGDDGIDCRYCHTTVETSAFAGIPPVKTCMNCHSQLFADSAYLALVRDSFKNDKPIRWTRVHDLPDFAYFNHSIHVNKGVGCSTCHGRVDQMPLTWQVASLQMEWCLQCHRAPERYVRPRDQVFSMDWQPPPDQIEQGKRLVKQYHIQSPNVITSCSTCHR